MSLEFVTGKGGVGKTRLSILLAQKQTNSLIAQTSSQVEGECKKIKLPLPRLMQISQNILLEEFLASVIKVKKLAGWASHSRLLQNLVHLAPNMDELLLFKKWIDLAERESLIVDAPSTGNFIALFVAIKTAQRMFDGGSLKSFAEEIDEKLTKGKDIQVSIVSLPERSALNEARQIQKQISKIYPALKFRFILNRKHEAPPPETSVPEELRELAFERPKLELKRIKSFHFAYRLLEGATNL